MKPALVYDGDCPFCASYAGLKRLRERYPDLELVNARDKPLHPAVTEVRRRGLKIDDGMALVDGDQVYYGASAMRRFHSMPDRLYFLLRLGRNVTLRLLGRRKLGF